MKACFETFGCRLSRAEALEQEANFIARGYELTSKHSEADVFIIRGCSVTAKAQRDCEHLIHHLKRHYPNVPMLIEGCLAKEIKKNTTPIPRNLTIRETKPKDNSTLPERTARAYLKVQDGCSGKCSFCIVPQFRGTSTSVDFDELVDKAKRFEDLGYHEIVITGCNLALYASKGKRLAELANTIANDNCRVRIGSIEPSEAAKELVDAMVANEHICRFLHLPVQSGSPRILAAMRRPYLVKDIDELVKDAVKKLPLLTIGGDFMTGFPGETDTDFVMTKGLIKRLNFANLHVFPYSERPKTIAAGLPMAIPKEIRKARAKNLADLGIMQNSRQAKKFIGKDVEVILENEKAHTGWTAEYFACKIATNREQDTFKRKNLVRIHVLDSHNGELKGIII